VRFLASLFLIPVCVFAQALSTPGSNGNFLFFPSISSGLVEGDPRISFTTWIKTTDSAGDIFVWEDVDAPNYGIYITIGATTAGKVEFLSNNTNSTGNWTTFTASTATNGAWTHVGITWDGAVMRYYQDGALVQSSNRVDGLSLHSSFGRIFYSVFDGIRPLDGAMQDIRLYKKTLSADEILEIYLRNGADTPDLSSLAFHVWGDVNFAGGITAGSTLRELSVNSFAVTASGSVSSIEGVVTPPKFGGY